MIDLIQRDVVPAALRLLPARCDSLEARAMLLAIGLQESAFLVRHQVGGPAHGFWGFELAGLKGVLLHPQSAGLAREVARRLRYPSFQIASTLHIALEHNDVLAAAFARLLLWTDPAPLAGPDDAAGAWQIYLRTWRPGVPRHDAWAAYYTEAWTRVALAADAPARC